jgi:hypothetical protein
MSKDTLLTQWERLLGARVVIAPCNPSQDLEAKNDFPEKATFAGPK